QAEETVSPYCQENDLGIISYVTLAGGILTGKFKNIPDFDEKDNRFMFYNFFKEPEWSKIQNFLDVLREIAKERNVPVVQVTINWTIQQIGITSALVGAKNPEQIKINAQAADFELDGEELERIEQAWEKYLIDIGK
ncbi:MAG: aldo/keto reductase, partial [Bacteroidota bacterium]